MKVILTLALACIALSACSTTTPKLEMEVRSDPYYEHMMPMACVKGTDECFRMPEESAKEYANRIVQRAMQGAGKGI